MTYKTIFTIAVCGGLTAFMACGGTVIIDNTDDDGGGGSSSISTSASSSTQVSSSVTSSSSGMPPSLCQAACDSLAACGGGPVNCVDGCLERFAGPCGQQHNQWLSCSLGETNTMCGFGPGQICAPQFAAYLACSDEVVGSVGCSVGPDGCDCSIFVSPGIEKTQACGPQGCECFIGGQQVGFCPQPEPSCDVLSGCCAGVLFTGGI